MFGTYWEMSERQDNKQSTKDGHAEYKVRRTVEDVDGSSEGRSVAKRHPG